STMRTGPPADAGGRGGATYSSITACALAPPAPNEDTPARRGPPPGPRGHGATLRCTTNGVPSSASAGLSASACSEGTNPPCRSCSSTLVSPAIPAALSQCPMLDFTDPIAHHGAAAAPTPAVNPA